MRAGVMIPITKHPRYHRVAGAKRRVEGRRLSSGDRASIAHYRALIVEAREIMRTDHKYGHEQIYRIRDLEDAIARIERGSK